tara:strand:- start:11969 stop:12310 length:342 start_codon:yes stop_codon:yes gene_type:complete
MDLNKKFIYINPDATAGESDAAHMYPVSAFMGAEATGATAVTFYFNDLGHADDTTVAIAITSGKVKEFFKEFVEEVNYGKEAVIVLADKAEGESFSGLVTVTTAATVTIGAGT